MDTRSVLELGRADTTASPTQLETSRALNDTSLPQASREMDGYKQLMSLLSDRQLMSQILLGSSANVTEDQMAGIKDLYQKFVVGVERVRKRYKKTEDGLEDTGRPGPREPKRPKRLIEGADNGGGGNGCEDGDTVASNDTDADADDDGDGDDDNNEAEGIGELSGGDDGNAQGNQSQMQPASRSDEAGEGRSKPMDSTQLKKRSPMQRLLSLKAVPDHEWIHHYIDKYGVDGYRFLNEDSKLHVGPDSDDIDVNSATSATKADKVVYQLRFIERLHERNARSNTNWCFQMLWCHDLSLILNASRPSARLRRRDLDKIHEFVAGLGDCGFDLKKLEANMADWINQGRRVNALCDIFGPGCLFILQGQLSEDFLKNKFSHKKQYFDEAIQHLRQIHLKEECDHYSKNKLGRNIRELLREPIITAESVASVSALSVSAKHRR